MKRPTIMDVARVSGVSKTTVSVILNESPASSRVPADTQQRVRTAAETLGYRPNWRAKALASRRTHTVGIIYAPPMPIVIRGNYESITAGINEVLSKANYHILFAPLGSNTGEWNKVFLDQRMDGCLILSRLLDPMPELLAQSRMPAVLVNGETEHPVSIVNPDEVDGSAQMTEHLVSLGHRRVTFFVGHQPPHYSIQYRRAGYERVLRGHGLGANVATIEAGFDAFMEHYRTARPTAVICYTHYIAVKLLQVLWEAGVRVPQDISVATYSNAFPVEDTIPPLTTMALPTEQIGRRAAEMVLEQIDTGGKAPPKKVILKETLIVRKSTAAPPG
jgi:LacI family transcriptional regulator